jgi:chromosomal replication initiator protein
MQKTNGSKNFQNTLVYRRKRLSKKKRRKTTRVFNDKKLKVVIELCIEKFPFPNNPITIEKLKSKRRFDELVTVRSAVMWIAFHKLKMSQNMIGDYFGKRNHATVIHAMKNIENWYQTDKDFRKIFDEILLAFK